MESWRAFWYSTQGPPFGFEGEAGEVATKWVVSIWILSEYRAFIMPSAVFASPRSATGSTSPKQTEMPDVSEMVCVWILTVGELYVPADVLSWRWNV